MRPVPGHEPRECPPEFQERIDAICGFNKFGGPNFKIAWGQSEFIRQGNVWTDWQGTERVGYTDRYLAGGTPCWCILRWRDPAIYLHPEIYYFRSFVDLTGLHATGEYPWEGRYEVLLSLHTKSFVDGKMVIDAMPLSHILIDKILPAILKAENLTKEEIEVAEKLKAEAEKAEADAEIEEVTASMLEHLPVHYGAVSYSGQGCKTSVIAKKEHQIQQFWNRLARNDVDLKSMLGFHQGAPPKI